MPTCNRATCVLCVMCYVLYSAMCYVLRVMCDL